MLLGAPGLTRNKDATGNNLPFSSSAAMGLQ